MNDAVAMRFGERTGDLDPKLEELIERQRPFSKLFGQRGALEIFHHEEIDAICVADVVQDADVRMPQPGDGPCLAFESMPGVRARRFFMG